MSKLYRSALKHFWKRNKFSSYVHDLILTHWNTATSVNWKWLSNLHLKKKKCHLSETYLQYLIFRTGYLLRCLKFSIWKVIGRNHNSLRGAASLLQNKRMAILALVYVQIPVNCCDLHSRDTTSLRWVTPPLECVELVVLTQLGVINQYGSPPPTAPEASAVSVLQLLHPRGWLNRDLRPSIEHRSWPYKNHVLSVCIQVERIIWTN